MEARGRWCYGDGGDNIYNFFDLNKVYYEKKGGLTL
jgi:hypothetical protein